MSDKPINVAAAERLEEIGEHMAQGTTERDMAFEIAAAWRFMSEEEFIRHAADL